MENEDKWFEVHYDCKLEDEFSPNLQRYLTSVRLAVVSL